MKTHLQNACLYLSVFIASISMLTACHTVEGTARGAGQDIQAVANTVSPPPRHYYYRHHHRMMRKTTMMKQNGTTQSTETKTTTTTNTSY